jgi:hypothetical protein
LTAPATCVENLKILGGPASGKLVANVKALAPGGQAEAAGILVGEALSSVIVDPPLRRGTRA